MLKNEYQVGPEFYKETGINVKTGTHTWIRKYDVLSSGSNIVNTVTIIGDVWDRFTDAPGTRDLSMTCNCQDAQDSGKCDHLVAVYIKRNGCLPREKSEMSYFERFTRWLFGGMPMGNIRPGVSIVILSVGFSLILFICCATLAWLDNASTQAESAESIDR